MEDESIIALFFARNETAISETDRKYGRFLHGISMNILHSAQDSEECVNDAYLRTWEVIPPKRPEKFAAFISRIVRNLSLNRWKMLHTDKRGGGEVPLALSELEECIPSCSTVESEYDRTLLSKALAGFIRALPENKRSVFLCRYWYLFSVKEIAARRGMSESGVKSMLARTRSELRRFLEKEGIAI